MRILFYLPVVTPWWFENVITPLLRRLHGHAELHVLAPVPWQGTGVGPKDLLFCSDLPLIQWHLVDGDDHQSLRITPASVADVVDFVEALAPDITLCRSADVETVSYFPGTVRFLMEGGIFPFAVPPRWIAIQDAPFDHGFVPDLTPDQRDALEALIAPAWQRFHAPYADSAARRAELLESFGLPSDARLLLLPLEYEHAENFFAMHRVGASPNDALVREIADLVDGRFFLAVTDHPLNELHVDRAALAAAMDELDGRAKLVTSRTAGEAGRSAELATLVDGIVLHDSKSFAMAAFFGKPLLRRTRFETADWLHAYADPAPFLDDVEAGRAAHAREVDARLWTAFHMANNAFDPDESSLTGPELIDRITKPVDPARWRTSFERLATIVPEVAP